MSSTVIRKSGEFAGTRACRWCAGIVTLVGALFSSTPLCAQTQITTDGSLGPRLTLTGPNFTIGADLGQIRGRNLFHSFGQFNVGTSESATFTGPASIGNILSRVTGGSPSSIDGLLRSAIPGANFFLLNPRGVMFGPNASLDVSGSFHVSTADFIRLADGGVFHANLGKQSVLTVAEPAAFGFLSPTPAKISFQGQFQVPPGKSLSFVGGDVEIRDAILLAQGGRINITSVGAPGTVAFDPVTQSPNLNLGDFARLGSIAIANSFLFTSGDPAGTVSIRGGRLIVSDGSLIGANTGDSPGAKTGIELLLRGDLDIDNSQISAGTFGAGRGGDVVASAGTVRVTGGALLSAQTSGSGQGGSISVTATDSIFVGGRNVGGRQSAIGTLAGRDATGEAGPVTILTPVDMNMNDGAITASTLGDGKAGDITIDAGRLTLTNNAFIDTSTTSLGGNGGNVRVTAHEAISVASNGSVSSFTGGDGQAGSVAISTPILSMDGGKISTLTSGRGGAGEVTLDVARLTLTGGATVDSSTRAEGAGGTVTIKARESISVSGAGSGGNAAIQSDTTASGNAGRLSISTPSFTASDASSILATATAGTGRAGNIVADVGQLTLTGGSRIDSGTQTAGAGGTVMVTARDLVFLTGRDPVTGRSSRLSTNAQSTGSGGDVILRASNILLTDGGQLTAKSTDVADAGSITIEAGRSFRSFNGSVTTEALQGEGGNIVLTAGRLVHLVGSQVTTSVQSGIGGGGNITIDPPSVILDHSQVQANAFGGPGGNVNIVARIFLTNKSILSASSALGLPGTINIQSPITDVSGTLARLPETILQAATLLRAACQVRLAEGRTSSFVLGGRGGLAVEPGGLLGSPLLDDPVEASPAARPLSFSPLSFGSACR